jgi:ABC-type lipoprotein release transport system permease subunit
VNSLLAGWRVSLHRTLADWPIVAAAWLITVLAAVMLSAGPIYSSAAAEAGLQRALADAPFAEAGIEVSLYAPTGDADAVGRSVHGELQRVIEPLGGTIVTDLRGASLLSLPSALGEPGDQVILGSRDGLADHASLIAGGWPSGTSDPSEPIPVLVVDAVAEELHLAVGDQLPLLAQRVDLSQFAVPVRVVGIFAIDDAADPYWNGDEQLLGGISDNGHYRSLGPFLMSPDDLLGQAGLASVQMQWHTFPTFERLSVDNAAQLRARVEALPRRLQRVADGTAYVATGLPQILRDAERSLLVSRTGVLLLIAQLAILAAYAIVLTASLLVEHRRIHLALLRSRGAGPWQVALLALAEGLLIAIPAVLVAPWLAVGALSLLNVVGPLAAVSLNIAPRVTVDGYVAAGAAGIICVALLVLPTVMAARGFSAELGSLSRQETRTFGQRIGLDVALLAITGIALWQLRLYGAPLTSTVQGRLGIDPLLVAAPAIGLLAGGVLALRILPHLAQGLETVVSRGRDLVGSLGSRQLARRPLRYTRSALLLMLAMSMGVFALSYAATWSASQRDQAAYQSGADVRVLPSRSLGALPAWAMPSAYAALASIERGSPVERLADGVTLAAAGSADLLALDADTAAGLVLLRSDEAAEPLAGMMQTMRAGRPDPRLVALPKGAAYLRVVPRLEIGAQDGARVSVSAVVRDGDGLLYRVESEEVPIERRTMTLYLPLQPTPDRSVGAVTQVGARLVGPVTLAGLGVDVTLPAPALGGTVGVVEVSAGAGADGPWTDVPLAPVGWGAMMSQGGRVLADVPAAQVQGTAVQLGGDPPFDGIFGAGRSVALAQFRFLPASVVASMGDAVPVIANRSFLTATASSPGDTITARIEGRDRPLSIGAVVESFPTTDPARPLLIVDEPTLGLLRLQGTSSARDADEWWLAATDGNVEALGSALRAAPFGSAQVVTVVDRARSLSTDPVALGITGALTLGFVANGLFALVGLTVSAAVSARQRRTEFALLRALGLSGRQLSGSLWLENGSLVLVSLVAGTSLGLIIGWIVLPFVTVTQRATTPVPPVIVEVPWASIVMLEVVSAVALAVAVVAIGWVLRRLRVGSVLRMGED